MSRTYQTFLQNEVRALEITVRDQDGNEYSPNAAYTAVLDPAGTTVVPTSGGDQAAQVSGNKVSTVIGTATTAQVGTYYVIWRILKDAGAETYTYYHVTELEVRKLL
jgi:hypothetical protein